MIAYHAWKAGLDLSNGRSRATFYRLRKAILEATGEDIKIAQPASNVVTFRRVIEIRPAGYPAWAEELTIALGDSNDKR